MHLSYFIARRYLFAKKSHNVINIISLISAIGIAVGSCALIIVLSIYNGFEEVVRSLRFVQVFPYRYPGLRCRPLDVVRGSLFRKHRGDRVSDL